MMKKFILLSSLIIATTFVISQNLVIHYDGETLEPNAIITISAPANTFPDIPIELDIENIGTETLGVKAKKVENYLVEGSESTFCWDGGCYPPPIFESPDTATIPAGTIHENDFSGHYAAGGNVGESSISYVFWNDKNTNDSVKVTVIFTGTEVTNISQNSLHNIKISEPYPNPVRSSVNFNYELDNIRNASISIYSIVGSLVKEIQLSETSGVININTIELDEGFYFYRLNAGKTEIKSGKFIIQR